MLGLSFDAKKSMKTGEAEITVIKSEPCSTEYSFTSSVVTRVVVPGGHAEYKGGY